MNSSTEVGDASGVISAEVDANTEAEEEIPEPKITTSQEPTSQVTLTDATANTDSLSDEYVHVDKVPDPESEEIRNLSNQQSGIVSYLEYMPSIQFPSAILPSFLPGWLFPAAENNSDTSGANTETSENNKNFEIWLKETIIGAYTGSIEEEQRFRVCLVEAISEHFDEMQSKDNNFLTENSFVTPEEICYARASESQCTRRFLLMLLHRDTITMLLFLFGLCSLAKNTVDSVVSCVHQHLDSGFTKQLKCLRCILKERVSICLVSDHLPKCDSGLLTFVNCVSEEDQPAKPSVSERLWNNLFEMVTNEVLYGKVIRIITRAIESCGYLKDIVRMLKEDMSMDRNSFTCRCENMDGRQNCDTSESTDDREPSISQGAVGGSNFPDESDIIEVVNSQIAQTTNVGIDSEQEHSSDLNYKSSDDRCAKNNGGSRGVKDIKSQKRIIDKGTTSIPHPSIKRKQYTSRSDGDEIMKRKHSNVGSNQKTTRNHSSKRLKRKDVSGENDTQEKRRRHHDEGNSELSISANCDLQMEMLKIAGQENQPDSGFSMLSTSSYGDSGMYEQTTVFSESEQDDETVPKQIAININSPALNTSKDQATERRQVTEDMLDNVYTSDRSALMHQEIDFSLDNSEAIFDDNSDLSNEQDFRVESDTTEDMLTLTAPHNEKKGMKRDMIVLKREYFSLK